MWIEDWGLALKTVGRKAHDIYRRQKGVMYFFYDKMTDRVRRVMDFANDEARERKNILVNNGHILLGIIKEGNNIAFQVLKNLNVDIDHLKIMLDQGLKRGNYYSHISTVPLGPEARQTILYSIEEGRNWNIGCHHILLGLMHNKENKVYQLLEKLGVTEDKVREQVEAIVLPSSGGNIAN